MLDVFNLISNSKADISVFTNATVTATSAIGVPWVRPRGVSMAFVLCVGGGAGGGGGFTGLAANDKGGGGGGASSSTNCALVPLFLLPETLYVYVGAGGAGGASGVAGLIGQNSTVSTSPINPTLEWVVTSRSRSSTKEPNGGQPGTAVAAGSAGSASGQASPPMGFCLASQFSNGSAGSAGGAALGGAGAAQTISISNSSAEVCGGGAGGAGTTGTSTAGGSYTAIAASLISEARAAAPAVGSFNGSGGFQMANLFYNFGGCGGSAPGATGLGGNGGNGVNGSGGGGGGAGSTAGRGGDGGNGFVVIICW